MPTPGNIPRRRDRDDRPRRPAEIEENTPRRLWFFAHKAVEHGWSVTIHRDGERFCLLLTERHHCIHIVFERREWHSKTWNLKRNQVHTRCPAAVTLHDSKLRISGLVEYLEQHPAQCAAEADNVGLPHLDLWERLERGGVGSCEYHLPPDWWGEVKPRADDEVAD